MGVKHLQKVGHIYHCVASPLFLTAVHKPLETEGTNCWTWSHTCLSDSSTVLGLLCRIFHFISLVGETVQHSDSCTTKPCCYNTCSMPFRTDLLKYASPSLKKTASRQLILLTTAQFSTFFSLL